MAQNLGDYLRRQAIRMLRDNWVDDTRMLSQELYTMFRGIVPDTTGPISVTPPGGGDSVDFPPVDDLNIPPFDLDLPENGVQQPNVPEQSPTYTREETYFWHRAIFPGEIQGQSDGAEYNVTLHPNGSLITQSQFGFGAPNMAATKDVVARVTDDDLAGTVAANSWVLVFWIAEYLIIEETFRNEDGQEIGKNTEIKVLQEEYLFNAPSSGGGGKVGRVTVTITAREGKTPGQGRAILYDFNKGGVVDPETGVASKPTFTDGSEVEVYSSVTSEIPAGSDGVQFKRIDNAWFIDVQDCAASEDEGGIVNE